MAEALPADLSRVDPIEAWKLWEPGTDEWNRKWVAHVFRRAAFGASPDEIEKATAAGLPKTLDKLMSGEPDTSRTKNSLP